MAKPSRYPDHDERTGLPRWLKLSLLIAILVVVLVVAIVLVAGGGHERPSHGPGGDNPSSSVVLPSGHVRPSH